MKSIKFLSLLSIIIVQSNIYCSQPDQKIHQENKQLKELEHLYICLKNNVDDVLKNPTKDSIFKDHGHTKIVIMIINKTNYVYRNNFEHKNNFLKWACILLENVKDTFLKLYTDSFKLVVEFVETHKKENPFLQEIECLGLITRIMNYENLLKPNSCYSSPYLKDLASLDSYLGAIKVLKNKKDPVVLDFLTYHADDELLAAVLN